MSITFFNTANIFDPGNPSLALNGAQGVAFAYAGGSPYLYVNGYWESGTNAFSVSATGQLAPIGSIRDSDNGNLGIGGAWGLASLSIGGNSFVYAAGLDEDGMSAFTLGADGAMVNPAGPAGTVRDSDNANYELNGAMDAVGVTVAGNGFVVEAGYQDNGISVFSVNSVTGGFSHTADFHVDDSQSSNFNLRGVRALATAVVGATTYVVAAGSGDNGLTIFTMNSSGMLTYYASINDDAIVNLANTGAVATATVAGETYIFASGDTGLSVFRLPAGGAPANVFNISDTADLHITGVTDMVTAQIGGTTYLFASSYGESGVSAFAVAPDGTLVSMGNIADNAALALSGAEGLATTVIGGQTFLAVTGTNDSGVSLFGIDTTGVTIDGTAGADLVDATHTPANQLLPTGLGDTISGLGGNDILHGLGGNDIVNGGDANDSLFGDDGSDTLNGGAGNDTLIGGPGFDTLRGGTGNDTYVLGNDANAVLDTGGTADLATTTITRSLLAPGLTTIERLTLLSGNISGIGNNLANTIVGSAGANTLKGGFGNDTLSGGNGNDTLHGETGNDTLLGGAGNDTLYGAIGIDRLAGGVGKDVFVFNVAPTFADRDVIADFNHADDTIKLSHAFFTGMGTGPLKPTYFFAGTHARDADNHIIYNRATGALYYDSDGTGAHAQVMFAVIGDHATAGLASSDFVLI
jgi:Ca2+-binding RTX toxin-like protein